MQSDWSAALNERVLLEFGALFSHMKGRYSYSDEVAFDVLVDYPGAPRMPERARDLQLNPDGNQSALYGSVRVVPSDRRVPAPTFLVHHFGCALVDEGRTYAVERFRARADGDIRRWPLDASATGN